MKLSMDAVTAMILAIPAFAANPLGPGNGEWVREAPEDHGLSSESLEKGRQYLFKEAGLRNCLVVIKDGALIYEKYGHLSGRNAANPAFSMTKTLGAMLMGRAEINGDVDIDETTDKYSVPSPVDYPVTPRQIMSQAIAGKIGPGEKWEYDALGTNWLYALPSVFKNATKRQPVDAWRTDFKEPLGLSSKFLWATANFEWAAGSFGTCEDYALIGQLLLNKGRWAGHGRILSRKYVHEMTTPQTRYEPFRKYPSTCYGLLTWLGSRPDPRYEGDCILTSGVANRDNYLPESLGDNYYFLGGLLGQNVLVIPNENIVAVTMGYTPTDDLGSNKVGGQLAHAVWCLGLGKEC